jgi:hypothetical protein
MCMQWREQQLVYRTDGSMQLIISVYYILLYDYLQWIGVCVTTRDWVELIHWMSLQGSGYTSSYKCYLKYEYSYCISSQLIIFLCILWVCVCARMHTCTCACACTYGEGGWQAHQKSRTHQTNLIVRRAKIEMHENKQSYVHYLLITGCQNSYKWQAVQGPVTEILKSM